MLLLPSYAYATDSDTLIKQLIRQVPFDTRLSSGIEQKLTDFLTLGLPDLLKILLRRGLLLKVPPFGVLPVVLSSPLIDSLIKSLKIEEDSKSWLSGSELSEDLQSSSSAMALKLRHRAVLEFTAEQN